MFRMTVKCALLGSAISFATSALAAGPDFTTDVEVRGSLCVGFDCTFSEAFGFDTFRLKENNLRIHFNDTSSSGSFPTRDWRITINDTGNGGQSYFAITDADTGRNVLRVDANAPTNAMRVDSDGDLGLGTASPVVDVHSVDGNTPTLRLEQDQSNGFAAQTWDLAGNETNFFLRDVTNSSRLPFRVQPGAPTNTLFLRANGNVGMGVLDNGPATDLHLRASGETFVTFRMEAASASPNPVGDITYTDAGASGQFRFNIGDADDYEMSLDHDGVLELVSSQAFNFLRLTANGASPNTSADVTFTDGSGNGELRYNIVDGDGPEMALDADGNLQIDGTLTTGGPTCSSGCDRVFDEDYALLSIGEHADLMWANGHLPAVGPTLPGQPFNVTDKMGDMLNELEHAHIYIEQQQRLIDALNARVSMLESKFEE